MCRCMVGAAFHSLGGLVAAVCRFVNLILVGHDKVERYAGRPAASGALYPIGGTQKAAFAGRGKLIADLATYRQQMAEQERLAGARKVSKLPAGRRNSRIFPAEWRQLRYSCAGSVAV